MLSDIVTEVSLEFCQNECLTVLFLCNAFYSWISQKAEMRYLYDFPNTRYVAVSLELYLV